MSSEGDLVTQFAQSVASVGLRLASGAHLDGFIAGSEIGLLGASQRGNTGAADLLMVTADGRWWLIEAKLAKNTECSPSFLFGNQLARYAQAMETLGVQRFHSRLESFVYGRRKGLQPPEYLRIRLEAARDLVDALDAWCAYRGLAHPRREAEQLVRMLADQLERRTLTLAALVDRPDASLGQWIDENRESRSMAVLGVPDAIAAVIHDATMPIAPPGSSGSLALPSFTEVPQSYKPTPSTLPRVLSDAAYSLYSEVVEVRLREWTGGVWPDVVVSAISSAAFSFDLQSADGRLITLQVGRSAFAGGGGAGAHPLKLIVNLIWAADRVHETWCIDQQRGETQYAALELLVARLCGTGGMLVRGIKRSISPLSPEWRKCVRQKMRGDDARRPELVAVREIGEREGYGWPEDDPERDRALLVEALDAIEAWMGPPVYASIRRPKTVRAVPGMVR